MGAFNFRSFLLQFGCFRYCVLEHHKRERQKRSKFYAEYRRTMMANLGTILVTWAGIEMMIDYLIAWYHPTVGQHTIRETQPMNFTDKMTYIKKMARDPKFDQVAKDCLRDLRMRATQLNKTRKLIVHGVAAHRNGFSSYWHFAIREFKDNHSTQKVYLVKDSEILEVLNQMMQLSAAISPWIMDLTLSTDEARSMTKAMR